MADQADKPQNVLLDAAAPFNRAALMEGKGYFEERMTRKFGSATAREIVEKMNDLQIPLPRSSSEFISGTSGALLFSNKYGVVLRIEEEDGAGYNSANRANDSIWMLQPLGAVKAGKAHIEICPGVHYENRDVESRKLYWRMWGEGYHLWDERIDNAGRLPFKTPEFPEGVTVSVDRMAAVTLTNAVAPVKRALGVTLGGLAFGVLRLPVRSPLDDPKTPFSELLAEIKTMSDEISRRAKRAAPQYIQGVNDPQEILYGDLRRSFAAAWPAGDEKPSPAKMAKFWRQVEEAREDGKLIAGWNELQNDDGTKTFLARHCAGAYEASPHLIGQIQPDLQLLEAVSAVYTSLLPFSEKIYDGNPRVGRDTRQITTSDGYQDLVLTFPDREFAPDAMTLENIYGVDGVSHHYTHPYGLDGANIHGFAQGLLHMQARGMITEDERAEGLTYMWRNLQRYNPALAGVLPEGADADRLQQAVTGFAAAYSPADLKFMLDPANEPYIDSPGYAKLHKAVNDWGVTLEWAAAPETLLGINQQLEARFQKVAAVPRAQPVYIPPQS